MDSLFIILVPCISFIYSIYRSPEKAFLDIYIPILILIPQIFTAKVLFLPELNTAEATIIPIFIVSLFSRFGRWRFTFMDFLVASFIMAKATSEFVNWGYREGMNVIAIQLCEVWAPYSLTKLFILPRKLLVPFLKRIVFLMFIVVLVTVYELIFVSNLFLRIPYRLVFHNSDVDVIALFRYGIKRVAASFVHPILFGLGLSIVIFFNYWLLKSKLWSKNFSFFPIPFFKKSYVIAIALVLGLLATVSRGPILSTVLGFSLVGVGYSHAKYRSLWTRIGLIILVSIVGYSVIQTSLNINKEIASEAASTAIYRLELVDLYYDSIMQRPWLGWGRTGMPVIDNRKSIDNEYLFAGLRNGLIVPFLELFIMFYSMYRLFKRGLNQRNGSDEDSTLAFCLIGIYISLGISLYTVWMGYQIQPLFFIIVGLTEGYLLTNPKDFYTNQVEPYLLKKKLKPY